MSTIKVDTIATRTGSGNITASNTIAGTSATLSGTLGVGETSPLGKLHIKSGDSAASAVNGNANELVVENSDFTGITILGENESNIMFGDNEDPDVGRIEYHHSDNSMRLRTAAADKVVIASSGLAQFKSTGIGAGNQVLQVIDDGATLFQIRAEDGNISFPQAGAGIYLGVTSGTASNLLNDYEEGNWTPQLRGGGTNVGTTVLQGFYTKIGNVVHCEFNIQRNQSAANNNNMELTGLPFPHRTIPSTVGQAWIDNTGGDVRCFIYLPSDSSKIYFVKAGDNDSYVNLNEYDNGRYIYAAFTYMTDS
tara:strand:+ start:543 stop:1466 length:924 start_codon:yes stop_codon:yes gene_type:complete